MIGSTKEAKLNFKLLREIGKEGKNSEVFLAYDLQLDSDYKGGLFAPISLLNEFPLRNLKMLIITLMRPKSYMIQAILM